MTRRLSGSERGPGYGVHHALCSDRSTLSRPAVAGIPETPASVSSRLVAEIRALMKMPSYVLRSRVRDPKTGSEARIT